MCLTVPCEVIRVDGGLALVARGDARFEVSLLFLDQAVRPGDWVAVQAQHYAHAVLSAEEAQDILDLYARLGGPSMAVRWRMPDVEVAQNTAADRTCEADRMAACPECGAHRLQVTGGNDLRLDELEDD